MVWIATWNGLNRYDGTSFVTFKAEMGDGVSMPCDRIRRLEPAEDGRIMCLIEDRVIAFDTHTCRFDTLPTDIEARYYATMRHPQRSSYDMQPSLTHSVELGRQTLSNIRYHYSDKQGNLWFLDSYGAYVATPIAHQGTYINHMVGRYLHRMDNGDIWFCERDTRRVLVYDSSLKWKGYLGLDMRLHAHPVTFASVYSVLEQNGHLLVGCKPGNVLDFHDGTMTVYDNTPNVYDMVSDTLGRVWMASFAHGVLLLERGFIRPVTPPLFVRRLVLERDGRLMAATTDRLLTIDNVYAPTQNYHFYQRDPNSKNSLNSNAVMTLCRHDSTLFVGTEGGGINVLQDDNTFAHITKANGLGSDIVFEFYPLNDTTLLVQGNCYLAVLNTRTFSVTNYDRSFFHRNMIFGEVPIVACGEDTLLLALNDGLLAQPMNFLREESKPVRIALTSIQRSQSQVDYAVDDLSTLTLSDDERSVVIGFSALDYRVDRRIYYSTRLYERGSTPCEWGTPTAYNFINLQDLRPGQYVLEIKSTDAYGHWLDNTRTLAIGVTPTFVESTMGQIVIGLVLLIMVVITTLRWQYHRQLRYKRRETLRAYFELQERLSAIENGHRNKDADVLPIPEVIIPTVPTKDEVFLSQVREFMEANMDKSGALVDELAAATNMSRSTLNRKMHELFNLSAKDFMQEARIKHACKLLKTTDMASKEIAYACGFCDPHYFAKSFKASVGMTPTEYREEPIAS